MSPDDLLWTAARGGLTPDEWVLVVDHLFARLESLLRRSLVRDLNIYAAPDAGSERGTGFSVDFATGAPLGDPVGLQFRGTFGASDHEGVEGPYIGVQGWLYPYVHQQRVATTADGHNHIYLRYAKVDASDGDWEMIGCTGEGGWRILGWEPDTYGEFEGHDDWQDDPGSWRRSGVAPPGL